MMADYLCDGCGLHFDRYFREVPDEAECECGAAAKRTFDPNLTMRRMRNFDAQTFDPVVIHRDAEGNIRFPGSTSAPVPPGFERVELRTLREVRGLEREMNTRESARAEEHVLREQGGFQQARQDRRSELRAAMRHMSPYGQDFARQAMEEMDRRRSNSSRPKDPGFFVEAFTQDSSNREAQCDASTGWTRRKR